MVKKDMKLRGLGPVNKILLMKKKNFVGTFFQRTGTKVSVKTRTKAP